MKALVYTAEREMVFRDEPEPTPAADEALVQIDAVGICGSDMHAYFGHDPRRVPPLILGHEAAGTRLDSDNKGARVVLNPLITCGRCEFCLHGRENLCAERDLIGMYRAGAFAERIAMPARNLIAVPPDLSAAKAALTEPGATALHAVRLAARVAHRALEDARILVQGAGSVGLLTALILRARGARDIHLAETNILRRENAAQHADCRVFDPTQDAPKDAAYDFIFDAVGGRRTREAATRAAKPGAVIMHIGLMDNDGGFDARKMTLQEIAWLGCYTYTPDDLTETLGLLHRGELGSLDWVEETSLADGARMFEKLSRGECAAAKVVLRL